MQQLGNKEIEVKIGHKGVQNQGNQYITETLLKTDAFLETGEKTERRIEQPEKNMMKAGIT